MVYEKHVGIYENIADFEEDRDNLKSPWVAYIKDDNGSYQMSYSDDMTYEKYELSDMQRLEQDIQDLKDSVETLTEDEYEQLIALPEGGSMTITNINGVKKHNVQFNSNVRYYTYDPDDLPNIE